MKFNSSNNPEDSLYHDARRRLSIDVSNTSTFDIRAFTSYANTYLGKINQMIWQAVPTWEFDDSNKSDLPVATRDMVDSQQDYAMPSSAQKITRLEVKGDDGDFYPVYPIDQSDIEAEAMSEFYDEDGRPLYYDIIGRSLFLYPAPASSDTTLTAGLQLYFSREMDTFDVTDTATEPGFTSDFHYGISVGAAKEFAASREMNTVRNNLSNELKILKNDIQKFYSTRDRNDKLGMTPGSGYQEEYI